MIFEKKITPFLDAYSRDLNKSEVSCFRGVLKFDIGLDFLSQTKFKKV